MAKRAFKLCILISFIINASCFPKEHDQSINSDENTIDESKLIDYLKNDYETKTSKVVNKQQLAEWDFEADVGNQTKSEALLNQTLITAKYNKNTWDKHFKGLKPDQFSDPILKREIFFLSLLGKDALDEDKLINLTNVETKMANIYSTARICPYKNQDCDLLKEGLSFDPDIAEIMALSTDSDELEYVWNSWRNATGAKMRDDYKTYVELSNEVAKLHGYSDMGEMWRIFYETENFIEVVDNLWLEVEPLYDELHTYVLNKLRKRYPQLQGNLIPAHLLGNMWAQSWEFLFDFVKPFENASNADVTKELNGQGYTPLKMFQTADEFFQSLGLEPNGVSYNTSAGAIIEKPNDRDIVCHASAWDMYDGKDYRIKMCTNVNEQDFITIHHEMGHIQYDLLYKDQPITLRAGANPGFHEAVGDTIALSVSTPQHLQKIGLLKNYEESEEASLNALMLMALERVAFLPFGLLVDKWRWDVFSGKIDESEWNSKWWYYRETLQKVKAPNDRTEDYFDPGSKYHVPGNTQYIAYFIAHLLEFQLHKALCIEAKEYNPNDTNSKPLHKCDIYQSKEAGAKLRAGLSLGASRHWSEALEAMTGEKKQTGQALMEYFEPLYKYLKKENDGLLTTYKHVHTETKYTSNAHGSDQTIPIVVIGVLAIIAVFCISVYLVVRKKKTYNVRTK